MNDDIGFLEAMNGGGDPMAIMEQTAQQLDNKPSSQPKPPTLAAQSTTRVSSNANVLTGIPVNLNNIYNDKMTKPKQLNENDRGFSDIRINISPPKQQQQPQQPLAEMMDDDFDDFDPKTNLTAEQQKNDAYIKLAENIATEMDRIPDAIVNTNEIEQGYRMTTDPENPQNIFVIKFNKNEDQHWRLPWNGTTNLLCQMEPNKLMIEQTKYNSYYLKYALTPSKYKQKQQQVKKKQMMKSKKKQKEMQMNAKKYNISVNDVHKTKNLKSGRPPTTKFSEDFDQNKPNPIQVTAPSAGNLLAVGGGNNNNSLLALPPGGGAGPRGTRLDGSMLVHSQNTVDKALPTEQEKLITHTQTAQMHLKQNASLLDTQQEQEHMPQVTPLTGQIRPELLSNLDTTKHQIDGIKEPKTRKHARRVSLASVDQEDMDDVLYESDYSDDSDDDEEKASISKRQSKLNKFSVTVDISKDDDERNVALRIDEHKTNNNDNDNDDNYESDGSVRYNDNDDDIGVAEEEEDIAAGGNDDDIISFAPPKVSLESFLAVDITKNFLYLGDEYDALNYSEIREHSITHFINCAAGYCAFDVEKNLKNEWLQEWKQKREEKKQKQKEIKRKARKKRRGLRLKAFLREHPDWKPTNDVNSSDDDDDDDDDDVEIEDITINLNQNNKKTDPVDMVGADTSINQFVNIVTGNSPVPSKMKPSNFNSLKRLRFADITDDDMKRLEEVNPDFAYFKSNRNEYGLIEELNNEIADLGIDESDHSSMYDSCMESDEFASNDEYDSDLYDEYYEWEDEEIIDQLCPFKFLNIYAHNWEGYRILDLHMNEMWNFIEKCRVQNAVESHGQKKNILIFCTKNNSELKRLNDEFDDKYDTIGRSLCMLMKNSKNRYSTNEEMIFSKQISHYHQYQSDLKDMQQQKMKMKLSSHQPSVNYMRDPKEEREEKRHAHSPLPEPKIEHNMKNNDFYDADTRNKAIYAYKDFWDDQTDHAFWNQFEDLSTSEEALNRIFAQSHDRSATLALAYMIHSGVRLRQAYIGLLIAKPNCLRNQSFLRQLIMLDWMKHMLSKPGMKKAIPFRDELKQLTNDQYLLNKKQYYRY